MGTRKHRRYQRSWAEWLQIALLQGSFVLAVIFGIVREGHAHGGGLDRNGCHTNRSTGEYHCHRPPVTATAASMRLSGQPAPPVTRPATSGTASRTSATARVFANCAEARAAGRAPVRRGEPGYGPHLDRDNDGIGCEPYRGK